MFVCVCVCGLEVEVMCNGGLNWAGMILVC